MPSQFLKRNSGIIITRSLLLTLLATLIPGLTHAAREDGGKEEGKLSNEESRRTTAPAAPTVVITYAAADHRPREGQR